MGIHCFVLTLIAQESSHLQQSRHTRYVVARVTMWWQITLLWNTCCLLIGLIMTASKVVVVLLASLLASSTVCVLTVRVDAVGICRSCPSPR